MTATIRRALGALALAVLITLTIGLTRAAAQPCALISINNTTGVSLDLVFYSGPALHGVPNVTPGVGTYTGPPFVPQGLVSAAGNLVTLANACSSCITLQQSGGAGFICARVCHVSPCR